MRPPSGRAGTALVDRAPLKRGNAFFEIAEGLPVFFFLFDVVDALDEVIIPLAEAAHAARDFANLPLKEGLTMPIFNAINAPRESLMHAIDPAPQTKR